MKKLAVFLLLSVFSLHASAQVVIGADTSSVIDYSSPKEYRIGGVTLKGAEHLDRNVLIMLSGFVVGEKIVVPGDKISEAIKNLWKQGAIR